MRTTPYTTENLPEGRPPFKNLHLSTRICIHSARQIQFWNLKLQYIPLDAHLASSHSLRYNWCDSHIGLSSLSHIWKPKTQRALLISPQQTGQPPKCCSLFACITQRPAIECCVPVWSKVIFPCQSAPFWDFVLVHTLWHTTKSSTWLLLRSTTPATFIFLLWNCQYNSCHAVLKCICTACAIEKWQPALRKAHPKKNLHFNFIISPFWPFYSLSNNHMFI